MNRIRTITATLALSLSCALSFAAFPQAARGDKADKAASAPGAAKAEGAKAGKGAGKEVTLKGEMVCGKCALGETEKCQNVLKVTEGGAETKYYVAKNDVADKSHGRICGGPAKATVKGTVGEVKGKKTLTASDISYE
jgi:hypothetical protein